MNMTNWKETISFEELLRWRRHFHQHPELSFQEKETAAYIASELESMEGLEILRPTETSVVGVLKGKETGRTIAFRADIDALPIQEDTDLPFMSRRAGVDHACGHDCHAAMLLGAAKVLSTFREHLSGTVKFVFQHAEEVPPGGAIELVQSGVLDDVEYIFGQHAALPAPLGMVMAREGVEFASQDIFDIYIQGKSCHGSRPHDGIDPITVGAEIVACLNGIITKDVDSQQTAVVSLGEFTAGHTHNVVPDSAVIKGNIRTFSEEVRQTIINRVEQIVSGVTEAFHTTGEVKWAGYPSVENNGQALQILLGAAKKVVGEKMVVPMAAPASSSEDFANYALVAKSAYCFLGFGTYEQGAAGVAHNPKFKVNEDALPVGTKIFVQTALDLLGNKWEEGNQ